jgi:hypothetical protein
MSRFRSIKAVNARKSLLVLWLSFFAINLACALYLYIGQWIEKDNFQALITQLNTSYVTYVGMMTTFYLGSTRPVDKSAKQETTVFAVALASSLLWNLLISALVVRLVFIVGTVEDSMQQIGFFMPLLSWLVAPAVGFYFAQSGSSESKNA